MPSRPWRKCDTCEWTTEMMAEIESYDRIFTYESCLGCRNAKSPRFDGGVLPADWCSEWKSAEPETCGMCEWYINEILGRCLHADNINREGFYVNSDFGACEHFRRKDAD